MILKEKSLNDELLKLKKEEINLKKEDLKIIEEKDNLIKLERRYWEEFNQFIDLRTQIEDQSFSYTEKIQNSKIEYKELLSSDILNSLFHIWFDGPFGTISNFFVAAAYYSPSGYFGKTRGCHWCIHVHNLFDFLSYVIFK